MMVFRCTRGPLLIAALVTLLMGCSSSHRIDQRFDLRMGGERAAELRFTETRHIDSVADVSKLTTDIWKIEHYSYPDSIRLFVRVLDSSGYVVTHMAEPYKRADAPNYFPAIRETIGTGRRRKTIEVSPYTVREYGAQDSIPTSIALAIDQSGSMKGVKEVLDLGTELFISMKRDCDAISLTGFNEKVTKVFPLDSDTTRMLSAFRDYARTSQGLFSSVYDGILTSLKTLEDVPVEQPKVCVVFADGEENTSMTQNSEIYEYATKHNISIYCVGFAYANDEELQALSLYTGGKYYRAYSKRDLLAIFLDIYRSLQNYYLVTYVPPAYQSMHTVDVAVAVPGRDTMRSVGQYDKSPLTPLSPTNEFSRMILFAYNKADIDTSSYPMLDELADAMGLYSRVILEVQGHTDNIGGEAFNLRLSEARATAVREALIARGVEPERLRTKGYGFSLPVASNDTDDGRAQNRRTVFKILRK